MDMGVIKERLRDLGRRMAQLIGRGELQATDDAPAVQVVQVEVLAGEVLTGLERFQDFGVTSHAPKTSQPLAVFLSGDRSHGVVIAMADLSHRPAGLPEGDTALYAMKDGAGAQVIVHAKASGDLEVTVPRDAIVNVGRDATIDVTGNVDVTVGGDATVDVTGNTDVTVGGDATIDVTGALAATFGEGASINVTGSCTLDCSDLRLGGATGAAVARIGDRVDVGAGSSAGLWPIVEGSSKVTCVD